MFLFSRTAINRNTYRILFSSRYFSYNFERIVNDKIQRLMYIPKSRFLQYIFNTINYFVLTAQKMLFADQEKSFFHGQHRNTFLFLLSFFVLQQKDKNIQIICLSCHINGAKMLHSLKYIQHEEVFCNANFEKSSRTIHYPKNEFKKGKK